MIIRVVISSGQARVIRTFDAETFDFMTEKTNLIVYNPKTDKVVLLVPLQNVLMVELTEAEVADA